MPWSQDSAGLMDDRIEVRAGDLRTFTFQDALAGVEEVALAIAGASLLPEIVAGVARGARRLPGSPAITVGVAPRSTEVLRLVALEGFDETTLDKWGEIPLSMATPLTDVLRTGEPMYLDSRDHFLGAYPLLRDDIERTDRQRWAAVPLVSPNGPFGVIGLGWTEPDAVSDAERLYLLTLARLGGEAIRRSARDIERRDLVVMLAEASDRERIEIARDLHDHSVQRLAAVLIRIGSIGRDTTIVATEHGADLLDIEREVQGVVATLRDVIADLHPPDTAGLGLDRAIEDFATWLFGDRLPVQIVGGSGLELSEPAANVAYRIAQEALTNVMKHAAATSVRIDIDTDTDGVRVAVSDDGGGFVGATERGTGHIGMRTMFERAEQAGGRLDIENGTGVTITAVIPFAPVG